MHSFIQSTIFTPSLFHKNEPSITTAIHHNHPSINHALHGALRMAFVHARLTLSWLAHYGMHLQAHRLPTTTLQRDIYTYMHACTEMRTTRMMMIMMMMMKSLPSSSNPKNLLMSTFGGDEEEGGGGSSSIDCRVDVDAAASLMLRVDS